MTAPRYGVLFSKDLKNLEYHKQVIELETIVKKVGGIYRKVPLIIVDSTEMRVFLIP